MTLNKQKTKILSDRAEMDHTVSIEGVAKVKEIKYLGLTITLNKKHLVSSAKASIKQVLYLMKDRITSRNQGVRVAIFTAYARSLIIYHFTSLVAAGLITSSEVQKWETYIKKIAMGISFDITHAFVQNITDWWGRNTSQVV